MLIEADISGETNKVYEVRAATVVKNLQKNNMNAQFVSNQREALSIVLSMIPPGATVGRADSVTLYQLKIFEELERRNQNEILFPFGNSVGEGLLESTEKFDTAREIARKALLCDIYLTGTNAITLDGKLVNVDGWGNRVAAMIFGPRKVIVIAGMNKITRDTDEAQQRIRAIAPINQMRHYLKHNNSNMADIPCIKNGYCTNCRHEGRSCNCTVIIERVMPFEKGRMNVVLVGEELGI